MKALRNNLKIPYLPEAATDEEIAAAGRALCKLQEELREIQKQIIFNSKIHYDRYNTQKAKIIKSLCIKRNYETANEEIFEEKSKEIMRGLSVRKESIVSDQIPLVKMD